MKHRADVESRYDTKHSALTPAAKNGHIMVVRVILNHKADVDCRGPTDMTLLCFAGNIECVEFLLRLLCLLKITEFSRKF